MIENNVKERSNLLSAMFLVAGTCIGGGMLALPVVTGIMGFFPSFFVMLICWLAMTATGLLLMEVSLWMHEGAHVISMSSRFLGTIGRSISWLFYLFICYASLVAYTAGGGLQIAGALVDLQSTVVSKSMGCIIFMAIFGMVIYLDRRVIGRVNTILFVSMIISYLALVSLGVSEVDMHLLERRKWTGAVFAIPLLLTSFSFQTLVPSLTPYLKRNAKHLRRAIIGGTTIALIVYLVWQGLIIGIVPLEGPEGLRVALEKGEPANHFLRAATQNPWVYYIAEYFAFFAIVTSFLGIALGLFDFLADGLNLDKKGLNRMFLGLLIMLPTLFFAIWYERAFLMALDTSGGFGDSVLNGIIPILMVWIGRYRLGLKGPYRYPGGKLMLMALFLFYGTVLILESLVHMGAMTPIHR